MRKNFRVLAYKDSAGFFERDGSYRLISCNHYREQDMGMNNVGEVVSLPTSSVPPLLPGTGFQHAVVGIPQTTEFPSPTAFDDPTYGGAGFVAVTKIKDLDSGITTYVDTYNYNTNALDQCNGCCIPAVCPVINGESLDVVVNEDGTITATWDAVEGVSGYEYTLEVQDVACGGPPTGTGYTFTESPTATVPVTADTTYCFFVRTACARGIVGEWASIEVVVPA